MTAFQIRVPLLETYDFKENKARFGEKDERYFQFFVDPKFTHYYPDYEKEMNPNTGDDLGIIEIQTQLKDDYMFQLFDTNCVFLYLQILWDNISNTAAEVNFSGLDNHVSNKLYLFHRKVHDGGNFDVINFIFHDKKLRNNPLKDKSEVRPLGFNKENPYGLQHHLYDNTQKEVPAYLQKIRKLLEGGATMAQV